jgi:hypothetical protein
MRRGFWVIIAQIAATVAAEARPSNAPTAYDLPYCDEVYAYCLQGHSKPECDRLAAEAKQRGSWRIDVEQVGYPVSDIFTVSIVKKPGTADTYVETRQFGCHSHN